MSNSADSAKLGVDEELERASHRSWTASNAERARLAWWSGTAIAVLLFAARMLQVVVRAGKLPYADYWPIMGDLLRPSGWPRITEFFTFRNEHPIVVAKVLYWLNAQTFAGSNEALGVVVVGIVLATVVVAAVIAEATLPPSYFVRCSFVVAAAALLFAPHGVWNFYKSMSGAAWLSANLFVVLALWMQQRGHRRLTVASAVLASASYGTGLLVWPALLVSGMIQDRRWRPRLEYIVGLIVVATWYAVSLGTDRGVVDAGITDRLGLAPGLVQRGRLGLELIGALGIGGELIGALVLATGSALVVWAVRTQPNLAPWVGLFVFGVGSIALTVVGRGLAIEIFGTPSRYASLSAIALVGWLALALTWIWSVSRNLGRGELIRTAAAAITCAAVIAWASFGGREARREQDASKARQDQLEVLFALDLADESGFTMFGEVIPPITQRLETIGHYPFNGAGPRCGQFGDLVPPDNSPALIVDSINDSRTAGPVAGSIAITIEVPADAPEFDCMVAIDADRHLIGIGYKFVEADGARRVSMFARESEDIAGIVVTGRGGVRPAEPAQSADQPD